MFPSSPYSEDGNSKIWKDFLLKYEIPSGQTWFNVLDTEHSELQNSYAVGTLPALILVSKDKKVVQKNLNLTVLKSLIEQ